MPVTLSDDEVKALRVALDNYLPELRYDASRIKLKRDRHDLVDLDGALTRLRQRLG